MFTFSLSTDNHTGQNEASCPSQIIKWPSQISKQKTHTKIEFHNEDDIMQSRASWIGEWETTAPTTTSTFQFNHDNESFCLYKTTQNFSSPENQ